MRIPRFLPLIFAVPVVAIAILFVAGQRREVAGFQAVKGRVIEVSSTSCGKNGQHTCWQPVVEYSLNGGTTHILRSRDRLGLKPGLGSEIELLVNPIAPEDARIDNRDGHWGASIAVVLFAGIFLTMALAYGFVPRKYMPPDSR
ncbi:DUF3592 domain-containing protein [Pseudoduganella sp. HUAS MS19]